MRAALISHQDRGLPPQKEPRKTPCASLLLPRAVVRAERKKRGRSSFLLTPAHAHDHTQGTGHLYQGKSFPVETGDHLYTVLRYVERNPLRAGLVRKATNWRWSSLGKRHAEDAGVLPLLHPWPIPMPQDWPTQVHEPQTEAELEAVRRCVARGSPFGNRAWQVRTARRLGLESTLRPRGRPKKASEAKR
jgi:putative transposase